MLRIGLAVLHLLALGIGLAAIYGRARALRGIGADSTALRRAFAADTWWGIAFGLWVTTGLWRAFAGTEKSSSFYWTNHVFYAKMGLLFLILALEVWPMITLIRWRRASSSQPASQPDTGLARTLARVSDVQTLLLLCMVIAAVMLARGYGAR